MRYQYLRRNHHQNRHFFLSILIVVADEAKIANHAEIIPLISGEKTIHNTATAYVCENGTCTLPVGSPEEFAERLQT